MCTGYYMNKQYVCMRWTMINSTLVDEALSYELRDARDPPGGGKGKRLKPILATPRFAGLLQVGLDTPLGGSGKIKLNPVGSDADSSVGGAAGAAAAGGGGGGGGGASSTMRRTGRGGGSAGGGGAGKGKVSINGGISDEISAHLEHIHTGDQVVEFYARHGQASGVKFFYCNQQPPGQLHYRPYELVVCDRLDVDPASYFTISAGGVVNVCKGKETEFTPLGNFMREKSIFNALTRMKFFKHYANYKVGLLVAVPSCTRVTLNPKPKTQNPKPKTHVA